MHEYYGDDFCVVEHLWTGTVPGPSSACPATAGASPSECSRSGSSRDGRMSRENDWLDSGGIVGQLTAPAVDAVTLPLVIGAFLKV